MNAHTPNTPGRDAFARRPRGLLPAVLFGLFAVLPAAAARDPFWPIGYEPPKPEPKESETALTQKAAPRPQQPAKAQPPPVKTITEADWAVARKALTVSGFTQSRRPDTGETRAQVMINRRTYNPGDTLCFTNLDIQFVWRIESLAHLKLELKPVNAARITDTKLPSLKQ